ncbi:hypothetical protein F5B19DRAFT_461917 [Rostrohypoxylon terebratum]|nr:hypothetical protein F5B19DRAFT_461917 [Rostrohypoxylon terebratum]
MQLCNKRISFTQQIHREYSNLWILRLILVLINASLIYRARRGGHSLSQKPVSPKIIKPTFALAEQHFEPVPQHNASLIIYFVQQHSNVDVVISPVSGKRSGKHYREFATRTENGQRRPVRRRGVRSSPSVIDVPPGTEHFHHVRTTQGHLIIIFEH